VPALGKGCAYKALHPKAAIMRSAGTKSRLLPAGYIW
jgi:hypothetical protein